MIQKFDEYVEENILKIGSPASFPRTKEEIKAVCEYYKIDNYGVNDDYSIDVYENILLVGFHLMKLPIKFKHVVGYFSVCNNQLSSLLGSPIEVGDFFNCSHNNLNSLQWGPESVSGFDCSHNKLTSLEFGPKFVQEDYCCSNNLLKSLKGCPEKVETLHFDSNSIYIIDYFPEVKTKIFYNNNPISEILNLFESNIDKQLACREMIKIKPIVNHNGRYDLSISLLNEVSVSVTGGILKNIPEAFRYYEIVE